MLTTAEFFYSGVLNALAAFKRLSDVIFANRITENICNVADKMFSRELFSSD